MKKEEIFEKFYDNITKEETEYLEKQKKKARKEQFNNNIKKALFYIFGTILFILFIVKYNEKDKTYEGAIIFSILLFVLVLYWLLSTNILYKIQKNDKYIDYLDIFKKRVIKKMLLLFDRNLTYHPDGSIDVSIFNDAEFETNTGFYYSDDFISGKLKNGCRYIIGDVQTTLEPDKKIAQMFNGLFASVECPKNFNNSLYIRVNKNALEKAIEFNTKYKYKKLKTELDSKEFEKNFDVYASDKIIAMQLLTADIMQMLVDFRKEMNMNYEITIKNSHIYYRFLCGELFEINDLNKFSLDKEMLYKYYKIIDFSIILSEKLTELIKDTEY